MDKLDTTYWVVIKTPHGETRYIEASAHAIVKDVKDGGEAVRIARTKKGMK